MPVRALGFAIWTLSLAWLYTWSLSHLALCITATDAIQELSRSARAGLLGRQGSDRLDAAGFPSSRLRHNGQCCAFSGSLLRNSNASDYLLCDWHVICICTYV
jgi:hypothetical protein